MDGCSAGHTEVEREHGWSQTSLAPTGRRPDVCPVSLLSPTNLLGPLSPMLTTATRHQGSRRDTGSGSCVRENRGKTPPPTTARRDTPRLLVPTESWTHHDCTHVLWVRPIAAHHTCLSTLTTHCRQVLADDGVAVDVDPPHQPPRLAGVEGGDVLVAPHARHRQRVRRLHIPQGGYRHDYL